ncbi:hypothetical protein NQ315_009103 [Exocentrus adspersus]|uniref:CCHC-type domain-containing protein n=1 Tax=Exocentrus adspersus TaxID=1586481 RepID=A0AAV8WGJ6_9CUCU|nr:hypothetical protein NQ315_009089 [Exocentrus adspersus]KAJ8925275.1 hypothetical protein NQ315_009103 [Exocentrus adspersus]
MIKADKKEMNKKMKDLETKFHQLSTTGVIKIEGTVTTPSKVKVPPTMAKCLGISTYLRQFETLFEVRGEALEVLRTIPEASPNYATLISALERRRQRFEETLQQYEADISRMVNLAYPTAPAEVIEQLSVSSFIGGLRDPEIGQLVRLSRHKTISKALAHALEIEAVKKASRVAIKPYQRRDKKTKITDGNLIDSLLELLNSSKRDRTLEVLPRMEKENQFVVGRVLLRGITSQVRQIRVYARQNQDVKMKRTHTYLDDWMSHILEKHKNKRYSQNSTFNKRRRIRCWTCGAEGHMRSRCQQPNSVVKNPGVSEITM